MAEPTQEQLKQLWNLCKSFVDREQIGSGESVYQNDNVSLNACEFIENICDVVGYWDCSEEREADND